MTQQHNTTLKIILSFPFYTRQHDLSMKWEWTLYRISWCVVCVSGKVKFQAVFIFVQLFLNFILVSKIYDIIL